MSKSGGRGKGPMRGKGKGGVSGGSVGGVGGVGGGSSVGTPSNKLPAYPEDYPEDVGGGEDLGPEPEDMGGEDEYGPEPEGGDEEYAE
jgi:hypothetical protein